MAIDSAALVTYESELEKNRDLIRKTIAPTIKPDEFELFMAVCKEVKLNPMTRQIYALRTWDNQSNDGQGGWKLSIQTSIDGLRLLAERSGDYAGQIGPEWCGKDGKWRDVWVEDTPPVAARVGVIRKSFQQPLWSVAKFNTYAKRNKKKELTYMWELMPDHMIAKCAESLALRRAFPHETHGLYTREEMQQAMYEEETIEGTVAASTVVSEVREEAPANATPAPRTQPVANSAAPRSQQAPKPAQDKPAEQQSATNGNAPRPVPLTTIQTMAARYYEGGMDGLRKDLVTKFKVIGELSDEMIEKDYNNDAQALIHKAANEKRLAAAGTSGK